MPTVAERPPTGITIPHSSGKRMRARQGLPGLWLNLTAPPRPLTFAASAEAERIRKAELTSLSILAVFLFIIALVSNSLANVATASAVVTTSIGLAVAALLNRTGRTRTAAYLVPSVIMLGLAVSLVQARTGIRATVFPLYDLFALPIVISGFIADRRAPWILALIALTITLVDYSYTPHQLITVGMARFDEIGYDLNIFGWWGLINRDIALLVFAAFFSWQGAASIDQWMRWADQSEDVAMARAQEARREEERAVIIERFVKEVMTAIAAQANGQVKMLEARPPRDPISPFVPFINNHLNRIRQIADQLRKYQALWSHDQIGHALDTLQRHLNQIQQGYLPIRALRNLPPEAQGLEDLAESIFLLLTKAPTKPI